MPQAKPAGAQLIERLNALLEQKNLNLFALNSIKKEAQALLGADAFHAYIVFGMIACLEQNIDEVRENHLRALKLYPHDLLANTNYAASLANLGFNAEAAELYQKVYLAEPSNLAVLSNLIKALTYTGRIREARKLLINDWSKKSPSTPHKKADLINQLAEFLDKREIADSEDERIRSLAISHLSDQNICRSYESLSLVNDDGTEWVDYVIGIKRPIDQVVELNCSLADSIANEIPTKVMEAITVRYSTA